MRTIQPAIKSIGGLFFLFLSACGGLPLQSDALLQQPPGSVDRQRELTSVPFNAQTEYQCGPAALATLLQFNNIPVSAASLVEQVYLPARKGSLQTELISSTRRHQLVPFVIPPTMSALLHEIDAGNPVLVLQNLGLSFAPQWHYAVVVGYDLDKDEVILRSGEIQRHINTFALFERTWRRANYWGLVITPASLLPSTASVLQILKSGLAFEQTNNHLLAQTLYNTGLSQWPDNISLIMAVANISFSLQQFQQAEKHYLNVLKHQPDYAPAVHNLANVYMEYRQYNKAESMARKAVELGGRYAEQYKKTLARILLAQEKQ